MHASNEQITDFFMNKKKLATTVALCTVLGLASYISYKDYQKHVDNGLLMQEVEALTGDDVSNNDWYLHYFECKINVNTKAQADAIMKLVSVKAKVGGVVDLSNFTQYFNHIPCDGFGPCEKGSQVTCNTLWNQIIGLIKDN